MHIRPAPNAGVAGRAASGAADASGVTTNPAHPAGCGGKGDPDATFVRPLSAGGYSPLAELAYTATRVENVAQLMELDRRGLEKATARPNARPAADAVARVDAIAEANRQLHHANAELLRRCAELAEQRAGLVQRTATLERANTALASFNHSVSHDLRAPLRAIDGYSRILLDEYGDRLDADGRHLLERVRVGSQRMHRLIDALLRLADCTRRPLQRTPIDLGALARAVADEIAQANPTRLVDLTVAPGLRATADPDLLRDVLLNLLGNAWKYTRPRPRAAVELASVAGSDPPVFFVRDNGVGFDMTYADQLFTLFGRLHSDTEFEGTGIGLATVGRIIARHGGRIWAESTVGGGATVFFTLSEAAATAHSPDLGTARIEALPPRCEVTTGARLIRLQATETRKST